MQNKQMEIDWGQTISFNGWLYLTLHEPIGANLRLCEGSQGERNVVERRVVAPRNPSTVASYASEERS